MTPGDQTLAIVSGEFSGIAQIKTENASFYVGTIHDVPSVQYSPLIDWLAHFP